MVNPNQLAPDLGANSLLQCHLCNRVSLSFPLLVKILNGTTPTCRENHEARIRQRKPMACEVKRRSRRNLHPSQEGFVGPFKPSLVALLPSHSLVAPNLQTSNLDHGLRLPKSGSIGSQDRGDADENRSEHAEGSPAHAAFPSR
jgi:hypothetical protein